MLVFLLAMGCSGGEPDTGTEGEEVVGDATAGAALYDSCAGCHGDDGTLGTNISGTPSSDLTARVPAMTDAELAAQIEDGGSAMPSQYSDAQDIADVIGYLRETFP